MVMLYREFSGSRKPQTDRIEADLMNDMAGRDDCTFACLIGVVDGTPTVERTVKGTWKTPAYRRAIEAAQMIYGD